LENQHHQAMNTFFIWWHRRLAAHHFALSRQGWSMMHEGSWHYAWMEWHLDQVKRLSAPERKVPATAQESAVRQRDGAGLNL
jgi:hypothetical protein